MRGELLKFANGAAVINDSYNSSPAALHAMIAVLAATPDTGGESWRRARCGSLARLRLNCIARLANLRRETGKIDWVIGVAGDGAQIVEGAVAAGIAAVADEIFCFVGRSGEIFAGVFAAGDLMLVKGSRGVKMERVVEALLVGAHAHRGMAQGERSGEGAPLDALLHSLPVCCRDTSAR